MLSLQHDFRIVPQFLEILSNEQSLLFIYNDNYFEVKISISLVYF